MSATDTASPARAAAARSAVGGTTARRDVLVQPPVRTAGHRPATGELPFEDGVLATESIDVAETEEASPSPRRGLLRAAVVLVLVLGLQIGFIASYVGALHAPTLNRLPVAVVSGDAAVGKVEAAVEKTGHPINAVSYPDRAAAIQAVDDRKAYAAVVPDGKGGAQLRIASAGGAAAAQSLVQNYGKAAVTTGVAVAVFDDHPLPANDSRGLSAFYLVVGWVVGGYLAATALAIAAGSIPANRRRTQLRVLSLLAYSALSGAAGAVIAGPVLGIWTQSALTLGAFGAMIVFGAAMTAAALQGWLGILGTGAAIILFVVLGNPGSGGPFAPEMLPDFFRQMQSWVLPGVGTHLVRSVVYFGGTAISGDLIALWAYGLGGAVLFLLAAAIKPGRHRARLTQR